MMSTQPKAPPMTEPIAQLIARHHIHEVECVIPDMICKPDPATLVVISAFVGLVGSLGQ